MKAKRADPKAGRKAKPIRIKIRRQCGAIPIKTEVDGQLMVLLVTSRETGRWVIPKGWTAAKLTNAKVAAREAFEEAGIIGQIVSKTPLGAYQYEKRLTPGHTVPCEVSVFLLHVTEQLETWPEKGQRQTRWFHPDEAAALVSEPELATILLNLSAHKSRATFTSGKRRKAGPPKLEA